MKCKLFIVFLFFAVVPLTAQTEFGTMGGVNFTFYNTNQEQFGQNQDVELGNFAGVFVDCPIGERFHIQPELLYKGVGEFQFLNMPLYAEYYVTDNVSLLTGPSLNYFFDVFVNSFKVRADVSAAYHFSDHLQLNLKYTLGLEELSPNVLFLGMGFSI